MAFLKPKTDAQIEKMYERINENNLIHDTVDRELMNTILDKMIEICNWYFEKRCINQNGKARSILENNVLCYRIKNSVINKEAAIRDTVLSLLSAVWAFVYYCHECPEKVFTDSIFMNTIALSAVSNFSKNQTVNKRDELYYKRCNIPDGQPFKSKHYFFNDGTLTAKIQEFLDFNVNDFNEWIHSKSH